MMITSSTASFTKLFMTLLMLMLSSTSYGSSGFTLGVNYQGVNLEESTFDWQNFRGFAEQSTFEGFSSYGFEGGYQNQLSRNWMLDAFVNYGTPAIKKVRQSRCVTTTNVTVICELKTKQNVLVLGANLLRTWPISTEASFVLGGGVGYYLLSQSLELFSSGLTGEAGSRSSANVSPQLKIGVQFNEVELSFSYAAEVGSDITGKGDAYWASLLFYPSKLLYPSKRI